MCHCDGRMGMLPVYPLYWRSGTTLHHISSHLTDSNTDRTFKRLIAEQNLSFCRTFQYSCAFWDLNICKPIISLVMHLTTPNELDMEDNWVTLVPSMFKWHHSHLTNRAKPTGANSPKYDVNMPWGPASIMFLQAHSLEITGSNHHKAGWQVSAYRLHPHRKGCIYGFNPAHSLSGFPFHICEQQMENPLG